MADGVEKDQAREIVRAALKDRRKGKRKGAGGQSGQTDEVTLADDMCEDFEITCSGTSFESSCAAAVVISLIVLLLLKTRHSGRLTAVATMLGLAKSCGGQCQSR